MKSIINFLKDFWLGKKVLYAFATMVVEAIRSLLAAKYPDITLPSTEQVLALGGGLIACHTLTDVVNLIKDAILAYAQTKKLPKELEQ